MDKMVRKATGFEIFNHWVLGISCLLLALSGYAFLFHLEGIGGLFGGFETMRTIHNWLGVVFAVTLFLSMFFYLKEAISFDEDDKGWIRVLGGYLSKTVKVPPVGKLNAGQKLFYLALLILGAAISASGFVIWLMAGDRGWVLVSHFVHNVAFVLIMLAIPVHMYLGSLANPGTFRIMVYGTVPLWWAKRKHPKWVRELETQK